MDSLTQIVLGAAVGQAVQGKKLGNRAMLWGAVGGTIPDLDVIGNAFMSELSSLAFHRGISHSFFFAIVFSFFIARYVNWLYQSGTYRKKWYKYTTGALAILLMVTVGIGIIFVSFAQAGLTAAVIMAFIMVAIIGILTTRLWKNYLSAPLIDISIGWKGWYKLFFWSIITHPILDSFTVYGTQLFAPFSNYRVAFNNISVADPMYTVPFLTCLLVAAFISRESIWRKRINWLGIALSSTYMLFTIVNKQYINEILLESLKEEKITYSRYMTNPSILNNILWSATVESDSVYYMGQYSLFDREKKFKFTTIPKKEYLIHGQENNETLKILKWFSKDYFALMIRDDGRLQFNDVRYGTFRGSGEEETDYVFRFVLVPDKSGKLVLTESEGGPPRGNEEEVFQQLVHRIKGI